MAAIAREKRLCAREACAAWLLASTNSLDDLHDVFVLEMMILSALLRGVCGAAEQQREESESKLARTRSERAQMRRGRH